MQWNYVLNVGTYSLTTKSIKAKVVCNYVPNEGTHSLTMRIMEVVCSGIMFYM